VLNVLR